MRLIDADALFEVEKRHHDLYRDATSQTDKARRDEYLQVMCDINDAPTVDAITVAWLLKHMNEPIMAKGIPAVLYMGRKEQEANGDA